MKAAIKKDKREEALLEALGVINLGKNYRELGEHVAREVFKKRASGRFDRPKFVRLTERELALVCAAAAGRSKAGSP